MAWAENFGSLYHMYYVCEECNLKIPAHKIDAHEMTTGPMNGPEEVGFVVVPAMVLDRRGHQLRRVPESDIPVAVDKAQRPRMRKDKPKLKSPAELRGQRRTLPTRHP